MTADYVDDTPYVRHFIPDLAPNGLRMAAAMNGLAPPPAADFDYCELGCAHGDTLVALAAACPEGRFFGVDLSADHIATAKRLARDGAVENVGFLEQDFEALLDEDIGDFDYIVAHGLLSWVSPEKRAAIARFANAKLKPGGILYVSYNTLPGWSSVEPLRQLLLLPTAGRSDLSSTERGKRGLELAQAFEKAGALYFQRNPAAIEMLRTMERAGFLYLSHEYLHEYWVPMYFARVAWEMAASGLAFGAVLPLFMNFRDTAIPEGTEKLLASVTDRVMFESLKDYAVNEFFRRDLYVRGAGARDPATTTAFLDATVWGSLANVAPTVRAITLPERTVDLAGATFDAIFDVLVAGGATVAQIVERTAHSHDDVRHAITRMLIAEQILPFSTPTAPRTTSSDGRGRYTIPSPYNQRMVKHLSSDSPTLLASPVVGTALTISALEALALRMVTEVAASGDEAWVKSFVGRSVLRLRVGEQVVESRPEQERAILDTVKKLRAERLPKLVELGVVVPA